VQFNYDMFTRKLQSEHCL